MDEHLLQLSLKEKEDAAQQKSVKSQIGQITAEYEMKEAEIKQTSQRVHERLEVDRTRFRGQIEKIEDLLAHLDGSLYHWLCENTEGWENTIGKVIDEERILYAQGLEPQLDRESGNMFGVKVNLDNITSVHRTPDDYRQEKKNLEEQVQQINRRLVQIPITLQEEMSKLAKKYTSLLNPLRQEATLLRVEKEQIPAKRQNLQNQRHKLEMEELEKIAQEKEIRG
uniref:ATP-binding protein n=1 Tax=Candidatus Limisoma sp. TaxID=3076476 RepID=UPI004025B80E